MCRACLRPRAEPAASGNACAPLPPRALRDARDVMSAPKRGACRFGECLRSSSAVRRIRDARDVMSAPKRPRRNVKGKM